MVELLKRCLSLQDRSDLRLDDLKHALEGSVDAHEVDEHLVHDPIHAYGRHVLHDGQHMEMMIASWTRGIRCAPHDHGGSVGAVRVLRGEGLHQVWAVRDGAMVLLREEVVRPGEIVSCGPDMIHSLGDHGAAEAMATLHLYAGPIARQTVYDVPGNRTLLVGGGAWVPEPELIQAEVAGLVRRGAIA